MSNTPPEITVKHSSGSRRIGHRATTRYTGTREQLINACLVTAGMFPKKANYRRSSGVSHPESGRWYLSCEDRETDTWTVIYYHDEFHRDELPDISDAHRFYLYARRYSQEQGGGD